MTVAIETLAAESARPAVNPERHRAMMTIARRHMGFVAWPTVIMTASALAAAAASSAAALMGWWPYWAAMLFNAYMFLMLFMGVHEALHRGISGDDKRYLWLNDLVGWVCGMVTLIPYRGYDVMHMVHHRYTNDPDRDPDYWCKSNSPILLVARFFTLTPHYVWKMTDLGFHKQPGTRRKFWISAAHHSTAWGLFIAGFWGGWAYQVFMLWLAPTILNVAFIAVIFNWLPHRPHNSQERYTDSSVFLLPRPIHDLATRLDMFQTYHLMHHLFPRMPFYRLQRAFHEMRPLLEEEGAPIHDFQRAAAPMLVKTPR
jgi:beta-carotene hydroxylase